MAVGIIAEYNPFHNGHLYHLNKIKEMYPNEEIVLITNGYFTQRGECTLISKYNKTLTELNLGIDLIVELPFPFATQSSDFFAYGSIALLKELKVNKIIFGSETNNIGLLQQAAYIQLNNKEYQELVKKNLKENLNYPTALSTALENFINYKIEKPNDLLGLSYIKEILKQKANITPITIQRTNDYHNKIINNKITSATSIREALKSNKNITKYIPKESKKNLKNIHFIEEFYPLLKYKIITSNDLTIYQTVEEGIENRIIKYINQSNSLEELIENIKTKKYTYNRIKRMLLHILCNFTKEDAKSFQRITYIRVLGFNNKGQKYLKKIKKDISIPIITTISKSKDKMLLKEINITNIYNQLTNNNLIQEEYESFPIKK